MNESSTLCLIFNILNFPRNFHIIICIRINLKVLSGNSYLTDFCLNSNELICIFNQSPIIFNSHFRMSQNFNIRHSKNNIFWKFGILRALKRNLKRA